jgi:hypothetical protein
MPVAVLSSQRAVMMRHLMRMFVCLAVMVFVVVVAMRRNLIRMLLRDVQVNVKMWPVIPVVTVPDRALPG